LTVEMAPPPAPLDLKLPPSRRIPEVKVSDLYCSGFVTTTEISRDLNVLAKFPGAVSMMVVEAEYVYLSQGASDGVTSGEIFTAVRPTRSVRSTREGIGTWGGTTWESVSCRRSWFSPVLHWRGDPIL
jgi:hypothetical protein